MILDILSKKITEIANNLGYRETLKVIKSNRPDLCDYQCDNAFILAKQYHKSPIEIGNNITQALNKIDNFNDYFDEVTFAPPGFINMKVSNKLINKYILCSLMMV